MNKEQIRDAIKDIFKQKEMYEKHRIDLRRNAFSLREVEKDFEFKFGFKPDRELLKSEWEKHMRERFAQKLTEWKGREEILQKDVNTFREVMKVTEKEAKQLLSSFSFSSESKSISKSETESKSVKSESFEKTSTSLKTSSASVEKTESFEKTSTSFETSFERGR